MPAYLDALIMYEMEALERKREPARGAGKSVEAAATTSSEAPAAPPRLSLSRARSQMGRVLGSPPGPATPPLRPPVTVPFLWEEAPGKPKSRQTSSPRSGDYGGGARARPVPLKLPPRLSMATGSPSPTTVLRGPYPNPHGSSHGKPRTLSKSGSTTGRTMASARGLFSWRKLVAAGNGDQENEQDDSTTASAAAAAPDALCNSTAASSLASPISSSSSSSCSADHHGHGHVTIQQKLQLQQQLDGGKDLEGEEAKGYVRITRFRRNRSLPRAVSLAPTHLWANIRKSLKQITPWS